MVSSGTLKQLNIRPGIDKNNTVYQDEGAYVSAQWVRFRQGNPQKIGGYTSFGTSGQAYEGVARDSIAWSDLNGSPFYAVGSNEGLYLSNGQDFYDITPIVTSLALTSCFYTTANSKEIRVSANGVNTNAGDRFLIPVSTQADGLRLAGRYTVTSVTTSSFFFSASTSATTTTSADGNTTTFQFLLPIGPVSSGATGGWGSGPWGGSGGGWGVGVSGTLAVDLRQWSLATWGEDLIANPRNGGLYVWDRTNGPTTRAVAISGAPTKVNSIEVLSPPRILVAYGVSGYASDFDPMLVRWSDQEDYSQWTPTQTNAAGELRLQFGNQIQHAYATKAETLVFTDTNVYTQTYIGGDFVYSITQVGDACGLIGPHAAAGVGGTVYWMSSDGMFMYNGTVQKLDTTVYDNIFSPYPFGDGYNQDQVSKVFAGINSQFSEVCWYYPSRNATENDRYVIYNFKDQVWYDGIDVRTTWVDQGTFEYPVFSGVSAYTGYAENTFNADGVEIPSLLQTGDWDTSDGTEIMFIDQFIPDFKDIRGNLEVEFAFKRYPESGTATVRGPYTLVGSGSERVYMRGRGRQVSMKVRSDGLSAYWQMGKNRIRLYPDGVR